jgi:hypothetical protein
LSACQPRGIFPAAAVALGFSFEADEGIAPVVDPDAEFPARELPAEVVGHGAVAVIVKIQAGDPVQAVYSGVSIGKAYSFQPFGDDAGRALPTMNLISCVHDRPLFFE